MYTDHWTCNVVMSIYKQHIYAFDPSLPLCNTEYVNWYLYLYPLNLGRKLIVLFVFFQRVSEFLSFITVVSIISLILIITWVF